MFLPVLYSTLKMQDSLVFSFIILFLGLVSLFVSLFILFSFKLRVLFIHLIFDYLSQKVLIGSSMSICVCGEELYDRVMDTEVALLWNKNFYILLYVALFSETIMFFQRLMQFNSLFLYSRNRELVSKKDIWVSDTFIVSDQCLNLRLFLFVLIALILINFILSL